MKPKVGSLKRILSIKQSFSYMDQEKKSQITKIRNESGDTSTDSIEKQRIIRTL